MKKSKTELKVLFHESCTYIATTFDERFLKEWLKWNRLHLTRGDKATMTQSEFDEWVNDWKGKRKSDGGNQ